MKELFLIWKAKIGGIRVLFSHKEDALKYCNAHNIVENDYFLKTVYLYNNMAEGLSEYEEGLNHKTFNQDVVQVYSIYDKDKKALTYDYFKNEVDAVKYCNLKAEEGFNYIHKTANLYKNYQAYQNFSDEEVSAEDKSEDLEQNM